MNNTNEKIQFVQVTQYKTREQLEVLARQYPNAIIFYKAANPNTQIEETSIWAHGEEYKIGGGNTRVRIGAEEPEEYCNTHDFSPSLGDFYIKEAIIQNTNPVKYTRSAYVYASNSDNQLVWQVLDGNVSAENVYFPSGFERTKAWGTATSKTDPTSDSAIMGKNLKEVFEYYLVEEMWPTPQSSTDNKTAPSFTTVDGGNVLTVKYNNSSGESIIDDSNVLYNSKLYIKNIYNPKLTQVSTPSESITFGPNKITGMYANKGWSESLNGDVHVEGTRIGNTISVNRQGIINISGKNKSSIKIGNSVKNTVEEDNGGIITVEYTTENLMNLGSYTVSVQNENNESITTTYKNGETDVTQAIIPAISDTYYLSNKGTRRQDKKISKSSVSVQLPLEASKSSNNPTLTYKVYLPVYLYKNGNTTQKNYYGSSLTLYNNEAIGISLPGDVSKWYVEFPATSSVNKLTINGVTMTSNIHYTITTDNKTINNTSVPYKRLQFTDSAACTATALITLILN